MKNEPEKVTAKQYVTAEQYVDSKLLPLIESAIQENYCSMTFWNPLANCVVNYKFGFLTADVTDNDIYPINNDYTMIPINRNFIYPDRESIANLLSSRGYNIIYKDNNCFVINWPQYSFNEFLYAAALTVLQGRSEVEIHLAYAAPGQVLCLKPPAKKFLNFKIDLNLLIDQRHEFGYSIAYRENLIIMILSMSTAQKIIAKS